VELLGQGKRPRVTITINGHSWKSRVAIMRGRYLLGLSNANRQAAGVATGDDVEVELELDSEPRVVAEPADFARALSADPIARTAYDRLPDGRKPGAGARYRERKEARDAQTADREGTGPAAELGLGRARRGPREDPSFEGDVRRVPTWTIRCSARRWRRVDGSSRL
jgi:hypothetical protein